MCNSIRGPALFLLVAGIIASVAQITAMSCVIKHATAVDTRVATVVSVPAATPVALPVATAVAVPTA